MQRRSRLYAPVPVSTTATKVQLETPRSTVDFSLVLRIWRSRAGYNNIRDLYETSDWFFSFFVRFVLLTWRWPWVEGRRIVRSSERTTVHGVCLNQHCPAFRALVEENVKHYAHDLEGAVHIHGWVHNVESGEVFDLGVSAGPPGKEVPPTPFPLVGSIDPWKIDARFLCYACSYERSLQIPSLHALFTVTTLFLLFLVPSGPLHVARFYFTEVILSSCHSRPLQLFRPVVLLSFSSSSFKIMEVGSYRSFEAQDGHVIRTPRPTAMSCFRRLQQTFYGVSSNVTTISFV
ncbi:uncharacterized protein LACBIDRAFT_301893 [Laccaria bicolor S238N-H82]|uniref:Predicted protein n=1 Tax=Laccaria bicolor (strain S238N-H82 / ATCC MYA-4686) TaxID=486041 RepID=B0CPM8_LACBS|nr:uncharacterized protein LACBIDRAFT_301893 [Laccaria bicolor S238N-H82]EDR16122.1 predicted protein [Laccaria bicolor S238N-H82]|eukprot:XP_001874330.1 predicted protein [Laccaria bicolor S238N-H82]